MNRVQSKILSIYKCIKLICDKHKIRFFAIGGTSIGAERHNGFIPWDDDLDIAMPNKDFERFIKICEKELPSNLNIFLPKQSKHSQCYWAKIHDINTAFLEKNTYKWDDYKYGVFVDIMPMYGVPNGKEFLKYKKTVHLYRLLSTLRRNSLSQLTGKAKFLAVLFKPFGLFFKPNYWFDKLERYQAKYDFDECDKVGYTWWYKLSENTIFERKWFNSYYELPFEDTSIRCCEGNKYCLTRQFGDFMKLPPIESRTSNHDVLVIDLDNSYMKYNKKGELEL